MRSSVSATRPPAMPHTARARHAHAWLWLGTVVSGAVSAWAHLAAQGQATRFLTALAAVAFTAMVMGRAIDQVAGGLATNAVGLFQAVTGNIPELVIGGFALFHHLDQVVLGTIAGSALNLLLFANGIAYIAGGLRHRSLAIDTQAVLSTCVMLVLMVTVLVMPAVAVRLHSAAQDHQRVVSYVVAVVLLGVFLIALPGNLRVSAPQEAVRDDERDIDVQYGGGPAATAWLASFGAPARTSVSRFVGEPVGAHGAQTAALRRGSARGQMLVLFAAGLLLAQEADWLTEPMAGALRQLHIGQLFAGLFILAVVNNLSQVAPAVRFALRGDVDTAIAINLQGALQLVLMVAPLLMLMAPMAGAQHFTLVFPALMAVAMVVATLLVVFVVLDAVANVLEGVMLIGLYAVLASLFAWS